MSNLKIFTENVEYDALNQIYQLIKQPAFENCKVRIMPDVHAGAGCVIGFTADLGDKVIPNIVGVDIGCGMLTIELGKINIDFSRLDRIIREQIPSGHDVRAESYKDYISVLKELRCFYKMKDIDRINCSVGTLGGGNHFIEVDEDLDGNKYLIIHTGSRNLGKQVAEYYQNLAIDIMSGKDDLKKLQESLVSEYRKSGKQKEIQKEIENLRRTFKQKHLGAPKELCYLTGESRKDYLADMEICQLYAAENRRVIASVILEAMNWKMIGSFETIHNYIELKTNLVRKGAISAKKGEKVLIPINMRDGCIIGIGKGNDDWNCSAPHGAGRIMSRSRAKEAISIDDFEETMKGIFTTSVSKSTIDESPMAYKPMSEILENIKDTVDVFKIIKPIYNFKAG